jgi:hypothetical protein
MKNCKSVVSQLARAGIQCSVTDTTSIRCKAGQCWREGGCRIVRTISDPRDVTELWRVLQNTHPLQCAHLSIPEVFNGCILDYLRPSLCHGKNKRKNAQNGTSHPWDMPPP